MIQANELRLGNLVQDKKGKTISIHNINNNGRINQGFSPSHLIDTLSGIALTESILYKVGFYKADHTDPFGGLLVKLWEGYSLRLRRVEFKWTLDFYGLEIQINYLHQLQNLYFALTGTELEINL